MAYTTINKSTDYFNTLLYTGNDASPRAMTGVGFRPDWLWIKNRTGGNSYEHRLMDAVRGSNKVLHTSSNAAQNSEEYYTVGSFDSDGWTGRSGTGSQQSVVGGNDNGYTFVAWNWLAGGGQGSSNTDGSINTTYTSANTTAGFSISQYTGTGSNATIGHGLGAVPKWIIVKNLDQNDDWYVYHVSRGATKHIILNSTGSGGTNSTLWQDTTPTSSVFSIGTNNVVNTSGEKYIAYCFAEKTGYSKFGSYTGNGDADGTFVYTGFKPALIIIKSTGNAENWFIFDNKRPGYNLNANHLNPNSSTTETASSANTMDILSNGFKMRATNNGINRSGDTFIYAAIGQSLVGTNNTPCTAR